MLVLEAARKMRRPKTVLTTGTKQVKSLKGTWLGARGKEQKVGGAQSYHPWHNLPWHSSPEYTRHTFLFSSIISKGSSRLEWESVGGAEESSSFLLLGTCQGRNLTV